MVPIGADDGAAEATVATGELLGAPPTGGGVPVLVGLAVSVAVGAAVVPGVAVGAVTEVGTAVDTVGDVGLIVGVPVTGLTVGTARTVGAGDRVAFLSGGSSSCR